jgi:hypothetical protein
MIEFNGKTTCTFISSIEYRIFEKIDQVDSLFDTRYQYEYVCVCVCVFHCVLTNKDYSMFIINYERTYLKLFRHEIKHW